MNMAIVLVGNIRTWNSCRNNFISVFGRYTPDVFIQTYDRQYAYHPYIQKTLNFYEDTTLDAETIQEMFSGIKVSGLSINSIDSYVDTKVKPFISSKFPDGAHLSLSQYFSLHDALGVVRDMEDSTNKKYDCIVKTRFDVIHNDFEVECSPHEICVDAHGAGVFPCDWTIIATRDNMLSVDEFIMSEIRDMRNESSLVDLPHKLFLNGMLSTGAKVRALPIIRGIVRAK